MNIAEIWDYYVPFLYEEKYIESLAEFLKENKIKTILDCACGVGFPSIELKKRGFNVTCADKSKAMLKQFEKNMKKENIKIPYIELDWLRLNEKISADFDLVMCRGNSLLYVDSWDKEEIPDQREDILKALENFYQVLKEGGVLYLDAPHEKDYELEGTIKREYPERKINGKRVKLIFNTAHDWERKIRRWNTTLFINGEKYEFARYGYLITHEELTEMLSNVGFKTIDKIKLEGEGHYRIFIAKK